MLVEENFDVTRLTSFKCGGKIKKVFFPESLDEFVQVLKETPEAKVFGNLTNTLVSSDGYSGAIILTTKMTNFHFSGCRAEAECGLKGAKLSQAAEEKGLSGLEFMIAFPGTIGGEVFMNAGAHGQNVAGCLVEAKCYNPDLGVVTLNKEEMKFSYRTSVCQSKNLIVLSAVFELQPAPSEYIKAKMEENLHFRKTHQPSLTLPNCGSVFRNPEGNSSGRLLEQSGVKGYASGGARVWENHANFIINNGGTSSDILNVIQKMRNSVREKFNIELKPEVRFLGDNIKEVEICRDLKII